MAYPSTVPSAALPWAQLVNNEAVVVPMCTPVYSNGDGTFRMALGNGSNAADVIGIVVDPTVRPGATGNVLVVGAVTATEAQWDAVAGASGGLTASTKYYLSASVAGTLTTDDTSGVLVAVGLSSTTAITIAGGSPPESATTVDLTNGDSVTLPPGTPVYVSGENTVKRAIATSLAAATAISVVDASGGIAIGATGTAQGPGGFVTLTKAQWDTICGTSGGLAFGVTYYLSATVAGTLTATPPGTTGQYQEPVIVGISPTLALVAIGVPQAVGAASSVSGSGSTSRLTRYTGSATLGNASASDDGSKLSVPYLVHTGAWRNISKFVTPQMQSTATGICNDFNGGTLATWQASSYIGLDSAGGNSTISGFDATGAVNGEMKILHHNGDGNSGDAEVGTITLLHQTSTGATGSQLLNRMWLPANMDMILEPGDVVIIMYDEFRWRVFGKSGGAVNSLKMRKSAYNDRDDLVLASGTINDLGYNGVGDPATLKFQQNTLIRLDTTAGAVSITGIVAPPQVANTGVTVRSQAEEKIFVNAGANTITWKHSNGGSIGDDQIWGAGNADSTLLTLGVARFIYDWTFKKWLRQS